jgi:hypothetical protein
VAMVGDQLVAITTRSVTSYAATSDGPKPEGKGSD